MATTNDRRASGGFGKPAKRGQTIRASLEGLLSWRCGYATGLRFALAVLTEAKDPTARIKRELALAMADAKRAMRTFDCSVKMD